MHKLPHWGNGGFAMLYLMPEQKFSYSSQKCRGATLQGGPRNVAIAPLASLQPRQSNMDRLEPARIGLMLPITTGLLYPLFAVTVVLALGSMSAVVGSMA